MSFMATRRACRASLWSLLVFLSQAHAGPAKDERHPRNPEQPLEINLETRYCKQCLADGVIEGEPREMEFAHMPVEKLAKEVGAKKWVCIESPHFKIFITLKRAPVKHSDSPYMTADLARLKQVVPDFAPAKGTNYLTPHQRAHLYQVRLERLYEHFAALTGNRIDWLGMKAPFEVLLFDDYREYASFAEKVLGRPVGKGRHAERMLTDFQRQGKRFMLLASAQRFFRGGDRELSDTVFHGAQLSGRGKVGPQCRRRIRTCMSPSRQGVTPRAR